MTKNLIFVLYDSIYNSVFKSQVFHPLVKLIKNKTYDHITIISFEDFYLSNLDAPAHQHINFIFGRKLPFFGKTSLFYTQKQLEKILKKLEFQSTMARGPLAGFITLKTSLKLNLNTDITIQARGLCAEEFRFAMQQQNKNSIKKTLQRFIYKSLYKLEKQTYSSNYSNLKIEAVSNALKEYLVKTFNAHSNKIYIASNDIPEKIATKKVVKWKKEIRKKLNINEDHKVYVYSGSMKPWQCAKESIEYFKEINKNNKSFLLILSQDKSLFEKEINKQDINKNNFMVLNVKPNDLYKYLSAADYGLLFRDKDIINVVSRPTKMLEYQSVGLKIIHNNTIEKLKKLDATCKNLQ